MLQLLKGKCVAMSNINKEFESRIMLTESEYFDIVSYFMRLYPNQHFIKNTNIYYDTDELFLRKNHATLRVRVINDIKSELTLKISHPDGDDEINDSMNSNELNAFVKEGVFPDGEVKKRLLLLPYSLDSYKEITTLYNIRLEIQFDDHLLVIDKNTYGDIVDYNLEIETSNSIILAKQKMNEYAEQFNLAKRQQKYVGKAHRAIMAATKKD